MGECDRRSDAELLALSDTDAGAFRRLYDRHADRLYRLFMARGVDHHTAVDLTGETFAAAWQSRHRFRDERAGNALPWLCGIARFALAHAARHRAVDTAARERLGMLAGTEPRPLDEAAIAAIDGFDTDLSQGLDGLDAAARVAVELRVVHGVPYDEIAEQLGCSNTAARLRVSRALSQLRRALTQPISPTSLEDAPCIRT